MIQVLQSNEFVFHSHFYFHCCCFSFVVVVLMILLIFASFFAIIYIYILVMVSLTSIRVSTYFVLIVFFDVPENESEIFMSGIGLQESDLLFPLSLDQALDFGGFGGPTMDDLINETTFDLLPLVGLEETQPPVVVPQTVDMEGELCQQNDVVSLTISLCQRVYYVLVVQFSQNTCPKEGIRL